MEQHKTNTGNGVEDKNPPSKSDAQPTNAEEQDYMVYDDVIEQQDVKEKKVFQGDPELGQREEDEDKA